MSYPKGKPTYRAPEIERDIQVPMKPIIVRYVKLTITERTKAETRPVYDE